MARWRFSPFFPSLLLHISIPTCCGARWGMTDVEQRIETIKYTSVSIYPKKRLHLQFMYITTFWMRSSLSHLLHSRMDIPR